ncbi:hypothetical protein LTR17_017775 [Elasticomyces elasticus]|nr:hypothetical protein LTR17_017775 [Elasticomyces elasticus]
MAPTTRNKKKKQAQHEDSDYEEDASLISSDFFRFGYDFKLNLDIKITGNKNPKKCDYLFAVERHYAYERAK